jgi:hypothetical protein
VAGQDDTPSVTVLSEQQWREVDAAVDKGLAWISREQQRDGSFPTLRNGQPGVTSLCVLAFLAHGHLPGTEPYGPNVERALQFILSCQKQNGLIALSAPDGPQITRNVDRDAGQAACYNHAISALAVSELFGMNVSESSGPMEAAIAQALVATLQMQKWPKQHASDSGGWRYLHKYDEWDSDVSITGWQLMFLRSARNAGFDVPPESINQAVAYVRESFEPRFGTFQYVSGSHDSRSRGMAGAGVLALAHAGLHNSPEAEQAGAWLLRQRFTAYNQVEQIIPGGWQHDRYHYAVFYACHAMYQLGDRYWSQFFPPVARTLVANQRRDGSWPADSHPHDGPYGSSYTTALVVVSLGASNQLLPIFQR